MNKKYLAFSLLGLFVIGLATAGLITYYGTVEQELNIVSPIVVDGDTTEPLAGYSGGSYEGGLITITNVAPFSVGVSITEDAPEGVSVDYIGSLELSKKNVVFGEDKWTLVNEKVQVEYTAIGDSFNAEVVSPIAGYELVYYKDNSDRFNNPAEAIAIEDISGNLPYAEDGNADEYDMCVIEDYTTCNGAKIWYVPSDAVTSGVIDWSRASEFYFETNLIQYGELTIYDSLSVTPVYTIGSYVGEDIVTTTIA